MSLGDAWVKYLIQPSVSTDQMETPLDVFSSIFPCWYYLGYLIDNGPWTLHHKSSFQFPGKIWVMLLYLKELGFVVAIVVLLVVFTPQRLCQRNNWMLQRDAKRNHFKE